MRIHHRTTMSLDDLAAWLNPKVAGWMNYYGRFYRSAMYPLLIRVSTYLRRWAGKRVPAPAGLQPVQAMVEGTARSTAPSLRPLAMGPLGQRNQADEKSPVTGDCGAGSVGAGGCNAPGHPTAFRARSCRLGDQFPPGELPHGRAYDSIT